MLILFFVWGPSHPVFLDYGVVNVVVFDVELVLLFQVIIFLSFSIFNVRTHHKLETFLNGLVINFDFSLESLLAIVDDFGGFDVDHGDPELPNFGYLGIISIFCLN
jgi:hypothetical protein